MALLIEPSAEQVKTFIDDIQPYSKLFDYNLYSRHTEECNYYILESLVYNLINFFSECDVKTQIKIIDKVIYDPECWTTETTIGIIMKAYFKDGKVHSKLIKHLLKKYEDKDKDWELVSILFYKNKFQSKREEDNKLVFYRIKSNDEVSEEEESDDEEEVLDEEEERNTLKQFLEQNFKK